MGLYRASAHSGDPAELMMTPLRGGRWRPRRDPDTHHGAIEGDRPGDRQQGNRNAPAALNDRGLPDDHIAIAEDVIGANEDESQG